LLFAAMLSIAVVGPENLTDRASGLQIQPAIFLFLEVRMRFLGGRLNRALYWLCLAIIVALLVAVNMLSSQPVHIGEAVLMFICVPRLHDIGRSGWWIAAPLALEVGGAIVAVLYLPENIDAVIGLIALVIIGLLIWLGAVPGEATANRFGDPPAPGLQFKPSAPARE
jgi:uncharacterized membrane protein YhaH (DUF805 family)